MMRILLILSQINVSYVHLPILNRRAMFTLIASADRTNRIVIVPGGKIIGILASPKVLACTCLLAHTMRHGKSCYRAEDDRFDTEISTTHVRACRTRYPMRYRFI